MFRVIEPSIQKESDEPFCDHCINQRIQELAQMLGQEQESKIPIEVPPSEIDILIQRNEILEKNAREQDAKIEKLAALVAQLIK